MDTTRKTELKRVAAVAGIGAVAGVAAYTLFARKWHNRWGATDEEVAMRLPGDDIVAHPNMNSTRAITVDAAPEDIWPWLVQMGKGRGGLYSYDWLDIAFRYLDRASATEILPEFQQLKPGALIPMGRDDTTADDFYVHSVEQNRALVIGANEAPMRDKVSWAIVLFPVGIDKTRLIMRVRGDIEMSPKGVVLYGLLEPAAFVMLRKQMLNLKKLAEKTRAQRENQLVAA